MGPMIWTFAAPRSRKECRKGFRFLSSRTKSYTPKGHVWKPLSSVGESYTSQQPRFVRVAFWVNNVSQTLVATIWPYDD